MTMVMRKMMAMMNTTHTATAASSPPSTELGWGVVSLVGEEEGNRVGVAVGFMSILRASEPGLSVGEGVLALVAEGDMRMVCEGLIALVLAV